MRFLGGDKLFEIQNKKATTSAFYDAKTYPL
jgi:hypothetical protein